MRGRGNLIDIHGGSPLRLLLLLSLNNASAWLFIHALYGRLIWRLSVVVLPALSLSGLFWGEALCLRALEAPGVAAPLNQLHGWLQLIQ